MARPKPTTASFEEALTELEGLVSSMEHETLSLESLISSYERGVMLLKHCDALLQSAHKRIEVLQNPLTDTTQEDADIRLT